MKIQSIQILSLDKPGGKAVPLAQATDVSAYSFLTRGGITEAMNFLCTTVTERTSPGARQSITEHQSVAHVYVRASDLLSCVIITDADYPVRVTFSLINKILDEFSAKYAKSQWEPKAQEARRAGRAASLPFREIDDYLIKYQDPKQADTIMKVQQELDETKIILHKTIESVLQRGEKLDDLVDRSANLSMSSKAFYKTAKNQNSCCIIA